MDQGHIIFRVLHHENISITMDAGVSLFFGLHGQYTISTAQESYTVGASEVYAVSPFTLYRAVSGDNSGVLQITLSPEILQKADWSPRQMIDCYLSRSTLKDSVAQDIRRRCATLFRLYFQQTNQAELEKLVAQWKELLPKAEIIPISALSNFNIDYVKRRVEELMPDSPPYFEKDALTDKPARFFVTEIIREKILLYYQKEIPYAVEVVVELFKEDDELIHIKALIIVERDTQKGIIIGHQGQALKKVGAMARKDIERFFGKKVFLEMFVKVEKDWRNRDNILKNFGYQLD